MFGDLRVDASKTFRLVTQGSVYILSIHEKRGRQHVILRGEQGGERENVVVRDSDPRLGEYSLFDLEPQEWVGHCLEVATLTTSEIKEVEIEPHQIRAIRPADLQQARLVVVPQGLQEHPRISPVGSKGTSPGAVVARAASEAREAEDQSDAYPESPRPIPRRSPVPAPPPDPRLQYPLNQVLNAEHAAMMLRAITSHPNLFDDLLRDPSLRKRMRDALDNCGALVKFLIAHDR